MEKIIQKMTPQAPFVLMTVTLHYNKATEEWRVRSAKDGSEIQELKIYECGKFKLIMTLLGITHDEDVLLDVYLVRKKSNEKVNRFVAFMRRLVGVFFSA